MIFDKKEHKEICIQMIDKTNFPGNIIEIVTEFKKAVLTAVIKKPNLASVSKIDGEK